MSREKAKNKNPDIMPLSLYYDPWLPWHPMLGSRYEADTSSTPRRRHPPPSRSLDEECMQASRQIRVSTGAESVVSFLLSLSQAARLSGVEGGSLLSSCTP